MPCSYPPGAGPRSPVLVRGEPWLAGWCRGTFCEPCSVPRPPEASSPPGLGLMPRVGDLREETWGQRPSPPYGPGSHWALTPESQTPPRPPLAPGCVASLLGTPDPTPSPAMGLHLYIPLSFPSRSGHGQVFKACMCSGYDNEVSRKGSLPPFHKWGNR